MSLSYRIGCVWMFTVVNVDIAAADSDSLYLYQNVAGSRLCYGNILKDDLARLCHYLLFHIIFSFFLTIRILKVPAIAGS